MKRPTSTEAALPILTYHTSIGWVIHGYAKTKRQAERFIRNNLLGDQSRSLLKNYGFTLSVYPRSDLSRELNGGPEGWAFDIGKTVPSMRSIT